jgi:dephospho-CoA kinase
MLNVGLTGGIGSGKTTVVKMFRTKGALVIDHDRLAHFVQNPDGPAWQKIIGHFGPGILNEDRTINRGKLGDIVFRDPDRLGLLNRIVHPAVFEVWQKELAALSLGNPGAIVISDVPLLIEVGWQDQVDLVLLVYTPADTQLDRIIRRDGSAREAAQRRLDVQMPIEKKLQFADLVIRNEGSLEALEEQVDDIWAKLVEMERKKSGRI